jgi:hypothetical protein
MKKLHLYLLALLFASLGLGLAGYKWKVLQFPLTPSEEVATFTIQARVEFRGGGGPNRVLLQVPSKAAGATPGFTILEERLVSRGYGENYTRHREGRQLEWTIRSAPRGQQVLYYRASVIPDLTPAMPEPMPALGKPPELSEIETAAINTLFESVREQSVDTASFAQAWVRRFVEQPLSSEAQILLESRQSREQQVRFIAAALAIRKIPARVAWGVVLDPASNRARAELKPILQVHNQEQWISLDFDTAQIGLPEHFFLWSRSPRDLLAVEADRTPALEITVQRNMVDALAIAERRTEIRNAPLIQYSLLSLPVDAQAIYRILLTIPIGAFVMLILRNIIGIKTFGTFMPVLIALAFGHTNLLPGVTLFVVIVGLGLLARFLMEKLKLLLVPRLTAVLILTVVLMALVSIVSNRLQIEVGLSVALFPIVIMAMTIERMSIAWDERGPWYALKQGFGSLLVAVLAYLVMSWEPLVHLVFVFPELLLVLFAMTLLIGRYSGYRLNELMRFRKLSELAEQLPASGAVSPAPAAAAPGKHKDGEGKP